MKMRLPWAAAVLIAVAAAALRAQGAAALAPMLPAEFDTQTGQRIRVTMVAGGFVHPWSIVFPDARTILVAERSGKIRMIRDGMLQPQPVWEAPPHPASDNGLQFLALHPQFDQNHLVYLSYPKRGDKGTTLAISRGRFDGTIPPDNPFVGRAGAKPEIFTYGHRNGYGLAIHPQTGELWQAEIGPLGGDEVNVLVAGHNYGWPVVSMGRNYTGTLASDQPWSRPGMDNPRMFWVPSISPSSILWYTGDKFPQWKNSLFVGALTTKQLLRISFNQPSQAEKREPLLASLNVRIRDVQQSPDGYIYVATEGAIRGDAADGMVLRLEPAN